MDSDQNTLRDAEILIAALPGGVFAAPAQNTRFSIEQAPHRFAQRYIQRFYAEHLLPQSLSLARTVKSGGASVVDADSELI